MLTRAPVVAAVSLCGRDEHVVAWAAREAARRGTRLVLTGVRAPPAEVLPLPGAGPGPLGRELRLAAAREPGIDVGFRATADLGGAGDPQGDGALLDLSEEAALLVLGSDSLPSPGTLGSAAPLPERLAVRAGCPIVLLPRRLRRRVPARRTMITRWGAELDVRALVVAASETAARAAWLTVVAALRHQDDRPRNARRRADDEEPPMAALAELGRTNPRLVVDLLHRRGPLSEELARAAEQADLLVIGCRDEDLPWSGSPQSVGGSLLRTATCPLMLVGAGVRRPFGGPARASRRRAAAPPGGACA